MNPLRKILLAVSLVLTTMAAQAQVNVPVQVKPTISYSQNNTRYILGGLTIDGGGDIDETLLVNLSGLEVGQVYDVPGDDISEAIRRFMKQKLFSNVRIEADSIVGSQIFLHIYLSSHPRISSINYSGVKKSEREELERRVGLTVGSQVTADVLDRTKIYIKRYFDEKGFKNASVEIEQTEDATGENNVLLDIRINKNEKVKIHRIYITGVTHKEASRVKGAMKKTKEKTFKNFLRSKKFIPEKYAEDKDNAISRLNAWGYRDALLLSDSVANRPDGKVDIYLDFYKGKKYYLRNVEWVGNKVYTTEQLNYMLRMKRGDVYDLTLLDRRLNSDDDAVGQQYYNNGYVFYQLNPVEINIDGDSIDLEMRIVENNQATFNRVRIAGNDRVYENVIRRELRTKPGDLFSMESIKRTVMDLNNMNQFDAEALQAGLSKNIKPDHVSGTVDITYPLVSKGGDQVELSAGWGQTGVVGRIGLKFTNFSVQDIFQKGYKRGGFLPQGNGQTLSLQVQSNGTYYQSYGLSFLEPWFGGKRPNQLSLSISYSKQSDINSNYVNQNYYNNYYNYMYGYGSSSNYYTDAYDPDKYVKLLGVSLGFGKRLRWPDDYFTFMAELAYTRYMLKNWQYFLITDGNCNNFNLTLSLSRNSTEHPFYPRQGSEFLFQVTLTPPYSLWDKKDYKNLANNYQSASYQREAQEKYRFIEYHKWKMKLRTYMALNNAVKTPVLMTRFEWGILGAYNQHKKSPFETYYVGGDGMSGYSTGYAQETIGLRGYDNGSLTPYYYEGYAYDRLTLELRYPLLLGNTTIYALGFLEGGNAWHDTKDFNPFSIRRSAGVGVRIMLPMVGLMGIDWGYGFDKEIFGEKAGGSHFHFVLGQEF